MGTEAGSWGISRGSGTRWRRGHDVSARFISESERVIIADLRHAAHSIRAIAMELRRRPSTVSREIRRNIHEPSGNYRPLDLAVEPGVSLHSGRTRRRPRCRKEQRSKRFRDRS